MKYMMLIFSSEDGWTEDERKDCMVESMAVCDKLSAEGKLLDAAQLHSVRAATSVRVREGKRQITDGPFAETTEQLGGFYLLDVENLDEAIDIAASIPPAKKGTVEVRPILPLPRFFVASQRRHERSNHKQRGTAQRLPLADVRRRGSVAAR